MNKPLYLVPILKPSLLDSLDAFHCVDAETVKQTITESKIFHSVDLGRGFAVHHGTREGLPIVIIECKDQQPNELGAVWFDETGGV